MRVKEKGTVWGSEGWRTMFEIDCCTERNSEVVRDMVWGQTVGARAHLKLVLMNL